jgi:hypothetical protein
LQILPTWTAWASERWFAYTFLPSQQAALELDNIGMPIRQLLGVARVLSAFSNVGLI